MRLALYNPAAGSSWLGSRARRARAHLERLSDVQLVPTTRGDIPAQTRRLLTPDVTAVLACGGDGTVSDVAAGLLGTDIPLCIVPCGTTNVLAREFGIPSDPVHAIELAGRSLAHRTLRTWTIGDRHLILGAGVGWDARLMHRSSARLKRAFGMGALMPLSMKLALTYDFPPLTISAIDADGRDVSASGTSALLCNSRFWSGANPAIRGVDSGDELLDVVVLEKASVPQLLVFWSLMMLPGGRPLDLAGVRVLKCRSLSVTSTASPMPEVHVNGDPAGHLPIVVEPGGSVRVRVAEG